MSFWPADTAGVIADVCSVCGLGVTIVLTTGAIKVKKRFERVILYPQHVAKLNDHCTTLNRLAGSYGASQQEAADEVARVRGNLNSLQPYVSGMAAKTLSETVQLIEAYQVNQDETRLRRLLEKMYQLLTEMQNLSERLIF